MPKHNEDFSNAEQEEKNKFHGGQDLVPGALVRAFISTQENSFLPSES